MKAVPSSTTQIAAEKVLQHNRIINQGAGFEVFDVPESVTTFSGYALLLFRETLDFPEGEVPNGTMIIPINIAGRRGYFIDRSLALAYS